MPCIQCAFQTGGVVAVAFNVAGPQVVSIAIRLREYMAVIGPISRHKVAVAVYVWFKLHRHSLP